MNITRCLLSVFLTFYLIYLQDKFDNHYKDTDLGDEYCTNINQNFLELLESAIQDEFLKDEKLSDKDVEEVCTILTIIDFETYKVNSKLVCIRILCYRRIVFFWLRKNA